MKHTKQSTPSSVAESSLPVPAAEMPFADTVLMCKKCNRKLEADGKTIRRSLKEALKSPRWATVELEKTGCFSLCPKGGQVLATLRKLGDRRLLIVEPGFSTEDALDYLLRPPRNLHDDTDDPRRS